MSKAKLGECSVCGSCQFTLENGMYFCNDCNTALEDAQELVDSTMIALDIEEDTIFDQTLHGNPLDASQHLTKRKKGVVAKSIKYTSWEVYSYILKGWVDELISVGVDPKLKVVTLQLWAKYLNLHKLAYFSIDKAEKPRLGLKCNKHDAKLIYGTEDIRRDLFCQVRKNYVPKENKNKPGAYRDEFLKSKASGKSKTQYFKELNLHRCNNPELLELYQSCLVQHRKLQKLRSSSSSASVFNSDTLELAPEQHQKTMINKEQEKVIAESQQQLDNSTLENLGMGRKSPEEEPIVMFNPVAKKIIDAAIKGNKKVNERIKDTAVPLNHLTLIGLLRVALILIKEDILISDLFRLSEDDILSLTDVEKLMPLEILNESDPALYRAFKLHSKNSLAVNTTTKLLLEIFSIQYHPNFGQLCTRYCKELQLPAFICEWTIELLQSRSNLTTKLNEDKFEVLVMAHIVLVIKLLFSLNDVTEWKLSEIASVINKKIKKKNLREPLLFAWEEWRKYITCRNTVISMYHYPTFLNLYKNDRIETNLVLTKWQKQVLPNKHEAHGVLEFMVSILKELDPNLNIKDDGNLELHNLDLKPSLTPLSNYLNQLITEHKDKVPSAVLPMLMKNFTATSVQYLVDDDHVQKLSENYGLKISIVDQMEENLSWQKVDEVQTLDNCFCLNTGMPVGNECIGRIFVPGKKRVVEEDLPANLPPAAKKLLRKRLKSSNIKEELIPKTKKQHSKRDNLLIEQIKSQSKKTAFHKLHGTKSAPFTMALVPEGFSLKIAPPKTNGKSKGEQGTEKVDTEQKSSFDTMEKSVASKQEQEEESKGPSKKFKSETLDVTISSAGKKKKKSKKPESQQEGLSHGKNSVKSLLLNRMHSNYWIADYKPWSGQYQHSRLEFELLATEMFPSSFVWLMKQCSSIIHCDLVDLYREFIATEQAMLNRLEKFHKESSQPTQV